MKEEQKKSPADILPPTTAGIHPEKFADDLTFLRNRKVLALLLIVLISAAFGLRAWGLGVESLSEDEFNKLQTVEEYRTNGLSGRNGEHPFLMKGLQTVSIVAAKRLNAAVNLQISEEVALRFPVVLFGTFTTLLIFLLVSELFGSSIGIVSAALWAVEPFAIGFDRIAKEDSPVLFFFLLTNYFWIRGQTEAERGNLKWDRYAWAAAAAFAGLMASKYYPFLLGITAAYYIIFRNIPERKWDMRTARWIKFFVVMGASFLALNPTIVLPETWREMLKFSSENRIGHDSYEFMGTLYRNQMSAWLAGVPWTFHFVFIAFKTSLVTLIFFVIGLPLIFKRRLGDGRFFIFFWAVFWLITFTFTGGKFTRYFTTAAPLVMIASAVGFCFSVKWLTGRLQNVRVATAIQVVLFAAFITVPFANSLSVTPHFRLFTNQIGGGNAAAGIYFPHDEFYDLSTREIVAEIVRRARPGAVVACETPALFDYYARKIGRDDITAVSLTDKSKVSKLNEGDFVVAARGRRYFSNVSYIEFFEKSGYETTEIKAGDIVSARIYLLDTASLAAVKAIAAQ